MFYSAAIELPDLRFAVTQNSEVISKYGLTHDVVLLLKKVFHIHHNPFNETPPKNCECTLFISIKYDITMLQITELKKYYLLNI